MRIQYNTQRPYTEKGQRIVMEYKPHEGVILFNDVDRQVYGEIHCSNFNLTAYGIREVVMFNYDRGCYLCSQRASDLKWEDEA